MHLDSLNGYINIDLFKRLIDEISVYPDRLLVLHRRGESLLHPDFVEICKYVQGKFKEVQIATNGTMLSNEKNRAIIDTFGFISFSLDAPEAFDATRIPARYETVERKILNFLAMNQGKVKTQVSMVQTDETPVEHIESFKRAWEGKVDRIRIYQEHSKDGAFGSLSQKREERKPCVMPEYEMLIYCDGKVGRCNHDWDGPPMGDVTTSTIQEVWESPAYQDLRKQHQSLKITDPVCKGCDSWYPSIGNQGTGDVIDAKS